MNVGDDSDVAAVRHTDRWGASQLRLLSRTNTVLNVQPADPRRTMTRIRVRILALAAAALLPACNGLISDPEPNVVYEADRQVYAPQDEIVTTLVNTSEEPVGYNLCTSTVEQRVGGGWRRVERTPEHPCALILFSLAPGESATYREPASRFPGPGTYRLRTAIETPIPSPQRDIVTEPFTVQ